MALKDAIAEAGKAAKEFLDKAQDTVTHAIDANGDGKLDFKDVKHVAEGVGDKAQNVVGNIKEGIEENRKKQEEKRRVAKFESDLKTLRPIFSDEINGPEFPFPKLVMLVNGPDKAHKESEACKDSVGFYNTADGLDIVTIYKSNADVLGVGFYPDEDSEAYYVNPVDRDNYISLKKYTEYLIIQRMGEMQQIAQALGAKHFKVKIVTTDSGKEVESLGAQVGIQRINADVKGKRTVRRSKIFDLTAESTFLGQEPVEPELKYLAKDPIIQSLVKMRLGKNKMKSQTFILQLSDTAGIRTEDALKIGAALKGIKSSAGVQFVNDIETQANSYFEYTVEF